MKITLIQWKIRTKIQHFFKWLLSIFHLPTRKLEVRAATFGASLMCILPCCFSIWWMELSNYPNKYSYCTYWWLILRYYSNTLYSVDCNITIGVGIISINYPQYTQETIKKMNGSDNRWVRWVRWDNDFNMMSGTQTQIFYNSATAVVFWEHFNNF